MAPPKCLDAMKLAAKTAPAGIRIDMIQKPVANLHARLRPCIVAGGGRF